MLFSDIIGQETIKKRLAETVNNNRTGHAYLFFGAEGVGKLPLATAFAAYISCSSPNGSDSCGTCAGCRKYKKFIHPDLYFIIPINKTKRKDSDNLTSEDFMNEWRSFLTANPYGTLDEWYEYIDIENKQGIINTGESRQITTKLSFKPFESDFKITIIWQADRMNAQAASKLLKILEEPPPYTVFILTSENPDLILPTVRSRCINIKIPGIDEKDISNALVRLHGLDEKKARETGRISGGSYSRALKLMNSSGESDPDFTAFRSLMRACYSRNYPDMVKRSEALASLSRERQKAFLEYSLSEVRECLVMHFNEPELEYVSEEEKKFTSDFAPFINGGNVVHITGELTKAARDVERNANGRILFLDLALKIAALLR